MNSVNVEPTTALSRARVQSAIAMHVLDTALRSGGAAQITNLVRDAVETSSEMLRSTISDAARQLDLYV